MVRRPSDWEIASQFNELRLALPVLRRLTSHLSLITSFLAASLARRPLANPFEVASATAAVLFQKPREALAFTRTPSSHRSQFTPPLSLRFPASHRRKF